MTSDFLEEIASIRPNITLAESEETWDTIAASISKLSNLIHNGMPNEIVAALREFSRNITSALKSERTRLCGPAMDLITAVSAELGTSFEPLLPIYFPVLLALCARSNKVIINKARATVFAVIGNAQLSAVLPYLLQNIKDKSTSLRLVVAESTVTCLDSLDPKDLQKENRSNDIEVIIKATSRDANADVRKAGKRAFMKYKVVLPNRVDTFVAPLTPTIRKYLEIRPKDSSAPAPKAGPSKASSQKPEKLQPRPLSSSTSAVPTSRSAHNTVSTSRPERPISVPPPAITTDITTSTNTNTLTASQRDAIKSAMAVAPKRPLPSGSHSNAMPPPTMPVRPGRPGTTASNSNITSLQGAPERPSHSRTMSQLSVAGASAPARMPAPPMRAEKAPANAPVGGTAPPPPQRFAVSSSAETSRERNAGPRKPELPKLQPEPVPRTRTRTVSMKNPKPVTNPNEASTHVDTSKSTTAIHSAASAAPLPKSKPTTVLPKTTKPSTSSSTTDVNQKSIPTTNKPSKPLSKETTVTTKKSVASGPSKPTAPSKPSVPAFKPTSTTVSKSVTTTVAPINKPAPRPRPGLTAPTAASQSRMQTKKSVVNLKGDKNTAITVKGLQTKKSVSSIRADKEKEIPRPKSRARSQTVTSAASSRPPSRRDQSRPPSRRADAEPTSRPPSKRDEQVDPPPSQKDDVEQVEEIELDGEQVVDEAESPQPSEESVVPVTEESDLNSTSPKVLEQETDSNTNEEQVQAAPSTPQIVVPEPQTPVTATAKKIGDQTKTPISALLLSIEEGFMFSPAAPLSPPEKYLNMPTNLEGGFRFGIPAPGPLIGGSKTGEKMNVEGREALGEVGNQ
uniref:TOG domain-containing protein n=1 Tax=Moniliophthora roreri TaxID=221103 RepID=A0A0W0FV81_MONRR